MAKKKDDEFKYLNMPLHTGQSSSRQIKVDWSGINYRSENDVGQLVYEKNISTKSAPYLTPSDKIIEKLNFGSPATSWNTPEDVMSEYKAEKMTINGEECYGIDFGTEPVVLYRKVPSNFSSLNRDTIEFSDGKTYDIASLPESCLTGCFYDSSRNGVFNNIKKIYLRKSKSNTGNLSSDWSSFYSKIYKAYKIGMTLSDRQLYELYFREVYFNDYGYITTSISAYKSLLFLCYYSMVGTVWTSSGKIQNDNVAEKGYVYANCLIYDTKDMQPVKLTDDTASNTAAGDVLSFPLVDISNNEARKISDVPEIKTAIFTSLPPSVTLADYSSASEINRRCLFFPQSYSLELDRVKDVVYKSEKKEIRYYGTRYECLNPFAFIDEFTDTSIVYNVLENPFCEIPCKSDLTTYGHGVVAFGRYGEYEIGNDTKENSAWILGRWRYSGEEWVPDGYDSEKKAKLPQLKATKRISGTPYLKDICVYQSRLFGINDVGIYASAYGDYSNWTLDDAETQNSSNAWMSLITSDEVKAGIPTAITVYEDAVIVFCENHIYEVRNKKNPFRIIDIFDEGCISQNAYCVVNGYLLFANKNGVRMYTGSKPKDIGYKLGFNAIRYASCGSDGINWYLYCETDKKEHNLFVYDTNTGLWSEREISTRLVSFATTSNGVFALSSDNKVYLLNSEEYDNQDWACETDFTSGRSLDIKHIKKIQMLADIGAKSSIQIHILSDDEYFDKLTKNERDERCVYSFFNNSENTKTVVIRTIPRKTANYRYKLRISGNGYSKVYQTDISIQAGGELFNG